MEYYKIWVAKRKEGESKYSDLNYIGYILCELQEGSNYNIEKTKEVKFVKTLIREQENTLIIESFDFNVDSYFNLFFDFFDFGKFEKIEQLENFCKFLDIPFCGEKTSNRLSIALPKFIIKTNYEILKIKEHYRYRILALIHEKDLLHRYLFFNEMELKECNIKDKVGIGFKFGIPSLLNVPKIFVNCIMEHGIIKLKYPMVVYEIEKYMENSIVSFFNEIE
jgi:hypothetical protein